MSARSVILLVLYSTVLLSTGDCKRSVPFCIEKKAALLDSHVLTMKSEALFRQAAQYVNVLAVLHLGPRV